VNKLNERRFLQDYKRHPEAAFRQLMEACRDSVFVLCRRVAASTEEAEDLAQEAFVRIWKGLENFKGESSLNTWIYRITWNVCASYIERRSRRPLEQTYTELDFEEDDPSHRSYQRLGEWDSNIKNYESRQFLDILFQSLPESHQLVLTLFYLQELSYEEIETVTGWPLGTVKGTLHRAKAKLREAAEEELRITNYELRIKN